LSALLHHLGGDLGSAAPDLVFIHGFGADRLAWGATAPAFFATHRVHAVELPAHGHAPAGATQLADIIGQVEDVLAGFHRPIALVGHSMGGALAAVHADAHPESVSHLVLIAPGGLGTSLDETFLRGFAELGSTEDALALLRRLVVRERLITPQMAAHVLEGLNVAGRRAALAAMAQAVLAAPPPPLPAMAHIIWGAQDGINPLDPVRAQDWGERLTLLPDTGHMPHVEAASKVNALLAEILAG
jgi:pimeloyl-ACP methyl ester carboxylesterase